MLTEILLDMIEGAALLVISPLPEFNGEPWNTWGLFWSNVGALNYFIPIAETAVFVLGVIALAPIFLGISFGLWIVALIRGGSSRG